MLPTDDADSSISNGMQTFWVTFKGVYKTYVHSNVIVVIKSGSLRVHCSLLWKKAEYNQLNQSGGK